MPAKKSVTVYYAKSNKRSQIIAEAMYRGIDRIGDKVLLRDSRHYKRIDSDIAVFYGLSDGLDQVFKSYSLHPECHAIYIDLGYWGRRNKTKHDGYHKFSVDSRHPTAYFQKRDYHFNRFRKHNIAIRPWSAGSKILLAGMSDKAARAEGLRCEQWERDAIAVLSQHTERQIVYRPKPNFFSARNLRGSTLQKNVPLELALLDCHAVVTHHSNVAVDALLSGIPVFCVKGVASSMGLSDLTQIEKPVYPSNREQWAYNIAWTQFTTAEMAIGIPWVHLKQEGILD